MKGNQGKIPSRYVPPSLTPSQRAKQVRSIREGTDRPKLEGVPMRRSPQTLRAKRQFGEGNTSKADMARILARGNRRREEELMNGFDEIQDKGLEAYRTSGSRPNVTPFAWAMARVFSVLFGGKSRDIDAAIVRKYSIPLLRARK